MSEVNKNKSLSIVLARLQNNSGWRNDLCLSDIKIFINLKVCVIVMELALQSNHTVLSSFFYTKSILHFTEISEEPCDGYPPLVDPVTGLDYNCSSWHGVCPRRSYCHLKHGKCCGEGRCMMSTMSMFSHTKIWQRVCSNICFVVC